MDVLESEGLRGVFFIESLHALKLGRHYLREMVETVRRRGHEVALHVHPEWLGWMDRHPLGGRNSQYLKDFAPGEQRWMIERAARELHACGGGESVAFRAGNFGASRTTLRVLAEAGVRFDSSYNVDFVGRTCDIDEKPPVTTPRIMEGLIEVPIAFIEDFPGHYRPMQMTAVSSGELRTALERAEARGFPAFVVVSHGFELIRRRTGRRGDARADLLVRRRFEAVMKYLGCNKDRYQVMTFGETEMTRLCAPVPDASPVKGTAWRTSGRMLEQLVRRAVA
jgi:peptidoglycan/xylan/chitin deacetylase (PgdA/CDA1 family)